MAGGIALFVAAAVLVYALSANLLSVFESTACLKLPAEKDVDVFTLAVDGVLMS